MDQRFELPPLGQRFGVRFLCLAGRMSLVAFWCERLCDSLVPCTWSLHPMTIKPRCETYLAFMSTSRAVLGKSSLVYTCEVIVSWDGCLIPPVYCAFADS